MDEYVNTSNMISKKCYCWININSLICANEKTPLQLSVKSYMKDYPKGQGNFHDIPHKKLNCFHWIVIIRNVPVY